MALIKKKERSKRKIIVLLTAATLVAVLIFGIAFFNIIQSDGGIIVPLPTGGGEYIPAEPEAVGIHLDNSTPTDRFILKNGVTDYKIVIRSAAVGYGDYWMLETIAAKELTKFFEEATGVQLVTVKDTVVHYSDDAKYISIGKSSFLTDSGIDIDYSQLPGGGFRIVTKGNSVFLTGGDAGAGVTTGEENGYMYAVYEFLYKLFDLDFYFTDSYSMKHNVTDIPLMNYDVTEVPDIEYRATNYSFVDNQYTADWNWYNYNLYRYRQIRSNQLLLGVGTGGAIWHNSFAFAGVQKMTYIPGWFGYVAEDDPVYLAHPKWFGTDQTNSVWPSWSHWDRGPEHGVYDGTQLCYNAHGDEAERDALLAKSFETLKASLILNTKKTIVTFTIQDGGGLCDCDECRHVKEEYGADSASILLFMNDLHSIVDEWFLTDEGKDYARELEIIFFAYHDSEEPPTKGDIKCADGVSVFFAPITADFTRSINDPINAVTKSNMEGWAKVSDKMFLWIYGSNFSSSFSPSDNFDTMQDWYKLAFECNTAYIFNLSRMGLALTWGQTNDHVSGWEIFKAYLQAKLAWDVNADVDELTDRFFDGYFGEASGEMREYFDDFRRHSDNLKATTDYGGASSCYQSMVVEKFYPLDVLLKWNDYIDSAIAALEPLRLTEPDRYALLYSHIANERLSVLYLIIEIYGTKAPAVISAEKLLEYKLTFKEDAINLMYYDISTFKIPALLTKWGVE
ncbi:MAG: DUF4838 domain-containing protein [Clostridiales bacterium]|jgi:hypothetical protein|nr:DUF4838 domain-containing protein [Clostridiales bacterium]